MEADERSRLAKTLFNEALEQPAVRRRAFLDEACGEDTELRARVDSLLRAFARDSQFMQQPAAVAHEAPTSDAAGKVAAIAAKAMMQATGARIEPGQQLPFLHRVTHIDRSFAHSATDIERQVCFLYGAGPSGKRPSTNRSGITHLHRQNWSHYRGFLGFRLLTADYR